MIHNRQMMIISQIGVMKKKKKLINPAKVIRMRTKMMIHTVLNSSIYLTLYFGTE